MLDEVVLSTASDLPVVGDQDPEDEDDLDDEDEDESPATTSAAAAAGEGSAAKKNKKKKKKSKAKKAVDALKYVSSLVAFLPLPPSTTSKDRPRTDSTSALRPSFAGFYRQAMPGNKDIPDAIMDRVMEEVGKLPEGQDKDQRTFLDISCSPLSYSFICQVEGDPNSMAQMRKGWRGMGARDSSRRASADRLLCPPLPLTPHLPFHLSTTSRPDQ